jgi:hypothetical protein
MSLDWMTIKIYLTPPLTPPFQNGGDKSFDELIDLSPEVSPEASDDATDKSFDEITDGSTNGSVKSFDPLIDDLWSDFIKNDLDGVEKRMGIAGNSTANSTTTGQYWYEALIGQIVHRNKKITHQNI